MIPIALLTDGYSGDLDLSQGLRLTSDLRTYVAQQLDNRLSLFVGEWFLDLRLGIPYWERIIGQKPDLLLLRTLFLRAIRETPGVASVPKLELAFDRAARTLTVEGEVTLLDGSKITPDDLGRLFVIDY